MRRLAAGLFGFTMLATPLRAQDADPGLTVTGHVAFHTGMPFSGISTVRVAQIEVSYPVLLMRRGTWVLEWPIAILPATIVMRTVSGPIFNGDGSWITWSEERVTSHGIGVKPVALRLVRRSSRVETYVGIAGGASWFDRPTPAENAHRRNYMGELDLGVRVVIPGGRRVAVGYRFNHLSNANTGEINPGIDSHMISLGVTLPR